MLMWPQCVTWKKITRWLLFIVVTTEAWTTWLTYLCETLLHINIVSCSLLWYHCQSLITIVVITFVLLLYNSETRIVCCCYDIVTVAGVKSCNSVTSDDDSCSLSLRTWHSWHMLIIVTARLPSSDLSSPSSLKSRLWFWMCLLLLFSPPGSLESSLSQTLWCSLQ